MIGGLLSVAEKIAAGSFPDMDFTIIMDETEKNQRAPVGNIRLSRKTAEPAVRPQVEGRDQAHFPPSLPGKADQKQLRFRSGDRRQTPVARDDRRYTDGCVRRNRMK